MASSIILVLEIAHCPFTLLVWCSDPEFIALHCISGFVSARHSKKPQLAVKWATGGHPTQSYNSLCQFRSQRRVILKISLCCHTDRYCWRILCCISTVFFHNCLLTQEHCKLFSLAQNISALFVWLWILWRKPKIMPSLRDSDCCDLLARDYQFQCQVTRMMIA